MAKIETDVEGKGHSIDADLQFPYALREDLGLRNPKFGRSLAQYGVRSSLGKNFRFWTTEQKQFTFFRAP